MVINDNDLNDKKISEPIAAYLLSEMGVFAPISPVIKWAGGKTQLLSKMVFLFPKHYYQYHEPFLGSGAVFFFLAPIKGSISFLSDTNQELINFYRELRDNTEDLIRELEIINNIYQFSSYEDRKKLFYQKRGLDRSNNFSNISSTERAVRFYFLNKTAYNGLYRTNSKGYFNVPWGTYENPQLCPRDSLINSADILKKLVKWIEVRDFEVVLENASSGDFVYFDPPYVPSSQTASFTSYVPGGFDNKDQKRLASICHELDKNNVKFMLSNSDMPIVHELYSNFNITMVNARRNINSRGDKRGPVPELIIRNYEE